MRRSSLAGQLLRWQVLVLAIVLVTIGALSYAQSERDFRRVEQGRALGIAESLATDQLLRLGLSDPNSTGVLPPLAEKNRAVSGASFVIITRADGTVVATPRPDHLDTMLTTLDPEATRAGRSWTGVVDDNRRGAAVQAQAPALDERGRLIGWVVVGSDVLSVVEQFRRATPQLLVYLGFAAVVGLGGALLLARHLKRQTLGLEPAEIVGLVEHREALLHGIREGVIGLDVRNRVTLVNGEAATLLNLPPEAVGRGLDELGLDDSVRGALTREDASTDRVVLVGPRIVTLNRMPVVNRGVVIGSVTTLRDRTELTALSHELDLSRHMTDTLQAQTHEFANRLHTIWGLLQIGRTDAASRFIDGLRRAHAELTAAITSRIAEPSLAALLVAKVSLADEQGVNLRLSEHTSLGEVGDELAADLGTVIGNLLNNAFDAVRGQTDAEVEVEVVEDGDAVSVTVRDNGPGIPDDLIDEIFEAGVSTKGDDYTPRGIGLSLVKMICGRRGGGVTVHNDAGAVFDARLPAAAPTHHTARTGGPVASLDANEKNLS